jgi:hypothetical protein
MATPVLDAPLGRSDLGARSGWWTWPLRRSVEIPVPQNEPATEAGDEARSEAHRPGRKTLWVVQQQEGNRTAFALVLAGYGDAWAAVELGRGLGPNHDLLALQPPDDEAAFAKVGSAIDLASLYVQHLTTLRPHGPYCLGGYSAGALLALEMARQLQAEGREVALLVMLDPLFLRYTRLERLSWLAFERIVSLLTPFASRSRHFRILSAMVQDQGLQRHLQVLKDYVPQPYPGRITLVEARWSRFPVRPPGFIAAWKKIALGGLDRRRPTGTHHSFMRPPHVGILGRQLGTWLESLAGRDR